MRQVAFYQVLSKFGLSDPKWKNVEAVVPDKTREEILAYVAVFMLHLTDASLGIFAHLSGPLADEGVSAPSDSARSPAWSEHLTPCHRIAGAADGRRS